MRIEVVAHTRAAEKKVILRQQVYHVYVTEVPEKGKANKAIIALLAHELKVPKTKLKLIRGESNKHKVFEIN